MIGLEINCKVIKVQFLFVIDMIIENVKRFFFTVISTYSSICLQ